MNTINLNGQEYKVIGSKEFMHKGEARQEFKLVKPSGKKVFHVVRYASGEFSSVI